MHGYGYPPQQPPKSRPDSATLITLRVIFVALTVLSCTFLGWAAMLRLAIVTRKPRDWWLLVLVVALTIGLLAFFASLPEEEEMTDAEALIGVGWLLVMLIGIITYYLIMEIRHYATPGTYDSRQPIPAPATNPYRPPAAHHQAPVPPQHPTPPPTPNPYTVQDTPPPPAPRRLDQVRAELDELSDYLRKEGEGR
ncbi:NnrS family protein [Streptomyces sp. cmx-18-6]|uniref:NnrS family protein n=1 Tax=Streptomyces sp. cmx-18-6 TaxID=2790930 RepID=UPI003980ABD0